MLGRHESARGVLQLGHLQAQALREAKLGVADRVFCLQHPAGHALVAAHQHGAAGPVDPGRGTVRLPPRLAQGAQMIGQREGGAARIEPGHDGDRARRKICTRIGGGDAGVVPLGDLAGEDRRQQVTRQLERCTEARHVVDDRHETRGRRDHPHPALDLGDLLVGHRGVAGGEVDRACDQPADALAAADGVVLDVELGMGRLERLDPLLVQGRREGGAGAADQLGGRLGVRAGQAGPKQADAQRDRRPQEGAALRAGHGAGLRVS